MENSLSERIKSSNLGRKFGLNDRKGQVVGGFYSLVVIAIVFGVLGVVLVFMADLVGDIKATQTANSLPDNIGLDTLNGYKTFSGYQTTLVTLGIIVVVIALLLGVLALVGRARGG